MALNHHAFIFVLVVLTIATVSCKPFPTKIKSLIGKADKLPSHNLDFTTPHSLSSPFHLIFVDSKRSQVTQNDIDIINKAGVKKIASIPANFDRPFSVEILVVVKSYIRRRTEKFATIHVLPGSMREAKEIGRNELVSTVCFSFHQFNMTSVQTDKNYSDVNYFLVEEDLHCITSLNDSSSVALNIDYEGALGKFNQSMLIAFNPEIVVGNKLVMLLRNLQSLEAVTRFVQVDLKNENATFEYRKTLDFPDSPPTGVWYYYQKLFSGQSRSDSKDRTEIITFDSKDGFSTETQTFAQELCWNNNFKQKDGLFSFANYKQRNEMSRWLDNPCLVPTIWSNWTVWESRACPSCPLSIMLDYQFKIPAKALFGLKKGNQSSNRPLTS